MEIIGCGTETYLFVNGLFTSEEVQLHDNVVLTPVKAEFDHRKVSNLLKNDVDFAVATIAGRTIASQLRINASDAKQLAFSAWNASWDCILLGAIFHCEVMENLQCDKPVEQLEEASFLHVTNYAFHAMFSEPYILTSADTCWIGKHYATASNLLEKDEYMNAVHAMASYRWHSVPRVQLAILWSGIEALFHASTEISFRISLYIANFLARDNPAEAKELFKKIRKLYSSRSAAVHGGNIKGDEDELVSESASLLNRIIKHCAECGELPNTENLIFPASYADNTEA